MNQEGRDWWARELLAAPRSIASYAAILARLAREAEEAVPECEMAHFPGGHYDTPERVSVMGEVAGPACSTVEASEYVALLVNGAGTVIGAIVEGAPSITMEG